MKKLILLSMLMLSTALFAQDFDLVPATQEQKETADKMAEIFDDALGLTSKQEALVSKNYAEFIAKKSSVISSDRPIAEKNEVLAVLYNEQSKELNDIFTIYQRKRFKEIRGQYDPLMILEAPENSRKSKEKK